MRDYLMVFVAVLFTAGDFACNKLYQKKAGTSLVMGLKFNCLLGLFTGVFFLIPILIRGDYILCTPFSLLMASLSVAVVTTYNLLGFRIMKSGSMALYTLFLMTGGLLIPYVWGIFFLQEEFSYLRTIGLLLMMFAVFWSNHEKKNVDKTQLLLCVLVFFLNGFVGLVTKTHQTEKILPHVSSSEFVMLSGFCRFVLSGSLYLVLRKKPNTQIVKTRRISGIILASAACSGLSYLLLLIGAINLPATVLYPLVTGGCMVMTSLTGVIFFKDNLPLREKISVMIFFIATFMFL